MPNYTTTFLHGLGQIQTITLETTNNEILPKQTVKVANVLIARFFAITPADYTHSGYSVFCLNALAWRNSLYCFASTND